MEICKIYNCKINSNTLGKHINTKHKIKVKDYYDKYIKEENEDVFY